MRSITRTLTAAALAGAALLAGAGAAGAISVVDEPTSGDVRGVRHYEDQWIVSPYGTSAMCIEPMDFRGGSTGVGTCWQQRYDGKWVKLDDDVALGVVKVYPVWEDPKAMLNVLPPQIRDQAEALLDR